MTSDAKRKKSSVRFPLIVVSVVYDIHIGICSDGSSKSKGWNQLATVLDSVDGEGIT